MPADAEFIVLDARIDLKQWNKAVGQMQADAKNIESLFSAPLTIKINVDDSGLRQAQGAMADLDTGVTSEIKFDATGDDIQNLRAMFDDPLLAKVNFQQTGDDIVGLRDKIDDAIAVDVKFNETGDDVAGVLDNLEDLTVKVKAVEDASVGTTLKGVEAKLESLQTIAKIQLVLDAAGFAKGLGDIPLVGQLIEIEELTHRVIGQTGRDLENAGRIINNVWTGNWGESKDEIAEVVKQVAQMRDANGDFLVDAENIEAVVVGAYQAASVGGVEATETLRAASQLVKNNTVPALEEAFDFIATGFSAGFNDSEDFLDTLVEYSVTFEDAKLGAQGLFNLIKTGTQTGVFNTDKMGDAFKEMFNLTKEEWVLYQNNADDATDRTKAIEEIGQGDEAAAFAAGEITGDEFAQGIIDALNEKFEDPAQQDRLAKAIFSPTMVEDAGLANLLQTDLTETNIWKGQAKALSDEIFSGTGAAFETMQRTLETHFLNALMNSVEAQEFMDKITVAAQRFGTELAAGADVGEALEIALEIPGLADSLHELESAFGNIAIVLLEVAASIGESFGLEVDDLRGDIASFAAGQFVFDIQTADTSDEMAARITSALNRGVQDSEIMDLLGQGVEEKLFGGDVAGAQALVDAAGQVQDISLVVSQLSAEAQRAVDSLGVEGAVKALQPGLDLGLVQGEDRETRQRDLALLSDVPLMDTQVLEGQVNTYVASLSSKLNQAITSGDFDIARSLADQLGITNIDQIIQDLDSAATLEAMFPPPTQADIDQFIATNLGLLVESLQSGDYSLGADAAARVFDYQDPNVQATIDAFTTEMMFAFDDALASGDTEQAQSILDLMGMSEASNTTAFAAMQEQMNAFTGDTSRALGDVGESAIDMGDKIGAATDIGTRGVDNLYGEIVGERSVLGQERLKTLAKRFDAVTSSIKDALDSISKAEDKLGSGAIEGLQVGGVGSAGATIVGEGGREMIFADERFAVLNNQTTERLFTALSGMAGGAGTTNNSRTINYSPTILVQNEAQAALFGGQSLDQLRGEAF